MEKLMEYLTRAVEGHATDLFIVAGGPICARQDKEMVPFSADRVFPRDTEALIRNIYTMANRPMDQFIKQGDDDFSFAVAGLARFRVNVYRQRGSMAAVIRVVAFNIPDWNELSIPEQVMDLARLEQGMVLIAGAPGSGKSTTQACIIDRINRTRECHVVTLEDPIEYLHRNRKSIVSQREIAIDTQDYSSALSACLRQAPDVILLGEMRDQDTINTAMLAAETGHLVIATLHTKGAVSSIEHIVDTFPADQQDQVRTQLSMVLHTVVSQQLVPGVNGGLVPAFEIMHMNSDIRAMIREGRTRQIDSVIAAGGANGMISMDQSLMALHKSGEITAETALSVADQLRGKMG